MSASSTRYRGGIILSTSVATGGVADKLGNRFEGRCVAYHLLELLAEDIVWLRLESIGDENEGVDYWTGMTDGTRHAVQCKRKFKSEGRWTIANLKAAGVLAKAATQLQDPSVRFIFASSDQAAELRQLSEMARFGREAPDQFFKTTLEVKEHKNELLRFCVAVSLDSSTSVGKFQATDLLARIDTFLLPEQGHGPNIFWPDDFAPALLL